MEIFNGEPIHHVHLTGTGRRRGVFVSFIRGPWALVRGLSGKSMLNLQCRFFLDFCLSRFFGNFRFENTPLLLLASDPLTTGVSDLFLPAPWPLAIQYKCGACARGASRWDAGCAMRDHRRAMRDARRGLPLLLPPAITGRIKLFNTRWGGLLHC
jgi:hypothetical protein